MFRRERQLSLKHVRTVIDANMKPMKPEMTNDVNIPSGGHLGSNEKTNSGHEYLQIAKYRVMGMLNSDAKIASSEDLSWNVVYV